MKNLFRIGLLVPFLSLGISARAETRILSHVTNYDGLYATRIILENNTAEKAAFTLIPFDSTGTPLTEHQGELDAFTTMTYSVDELFEEPEDVTHFSIDGFIGVFGAYVIKDGPGSEAHVPASSLTASRYRMFAGNWNEVFDGFAAVNMGEETVDVWVTQKDANGNMLQTIKVIENLAPMAKGLFVIGAPTGSPFTHVEGSYFEVYSEQLIAITALRGTAPGAPIGFLWTNHASPMSLAHSIRDTQGVWFISDGSLFDVMEMMGYNIARDRLWQLELYRRLGRGTLSELYGSPAKQQDILVRTTGYSDEELDEGFENSTADSKNVISAYIHGINRHISEVRGDTSLLPMEFAGLGLTEIRDWNHRDVLAWAALLQRNFDPMDYALGQVDNAALMESLVAEYGESASDMFNDIHYLNDPDAPSVIPTSTSKTKQMIKKDVELRSDINFRQLRDKLRNTKQNNDRFLEKINAKVKMGSYAWVVSGDKTQSGNPILYSGPQMGFDVPSITVEGSIRGGGLNISGMTVPGIPGLIIGRTPHHAWSMQVGHAHTADLYIESPAALGSGPHRIETITVAGEGDIEIPVYRTEHGPVVAQDPAIVAWKYAHWGYEFGLVDTMLTFARATSMDQFGDGIEMIAVSQHFCYADRDGNIAYWMSGRDPVREPGEYRFPQGAAALPLEWDIEQIIEKSHDRNTTQGYYGGWNNKSNPDYPNAPFGSHTHYGPFHRAHVITDYLSNHDELTFEEVRDLAINIAATDSFGRGGNPWSLVQESFTSIIEANPTTERTDALAMLNGWDGHFVAGGPVHWVSGTDRDDAWMLMDHFIRKVLDYTFEEIPGVHVLKKFNVLLHGLGTSSLSNQYDWFTNAQDESAPQTLDDIVLKALDDSLMELGERPWGTDMRGTIDYEHPLLPTGPIHQTPFGSRSTYVHCVEFNETGPIRIESMFPLGESGFIGVTPTGLPAMSPVFFGLVPFFDTFSPREFPLFD